MTRIQQVDDNNHIIQSEYPFMETKTVEFAGGTTNAIGDFDGTGNPTTLFTVTGDVVVQLTTKCTESLAGATATFEIGVVGNSGILSDSSSFTAIDITNGILLDQDGTNSVAMRTPVDTITITGGADIILTVSTANITNGTLVHYLRWRPLSSDGNVVAA